MTLFVAWKGRLVSNDELESKVNDWLRACSYVIIRQLSGLTEKNHETLCTIDVPD
jgi:hypothetical protein